MKTFFQKRKEKALFSLFEAVQFVSKNGKAFVAMHAFAMMLACFTTFARADWKTEFPLWATTKAVLDVLYPIFVVVGVVLLIVGIVMIFISRFNEQAITGPLIIVAVGVALIAVRVMLGTAIEDLAFNQMYPKAESEGWTIGSDSVPTQE